MKFRLRMAGALGLSLSPLPAGLAELGTATVHAEAAAPRTPCTYSRSSAVRLPLHMDDRTRANLSEIRLFVKAPGADWDLVQAAEPSVTSFDYRADKDGTYLFTFVTVDKKGRGFPADLNARPAHQMIVVDTLPPELHVMPTPVGREIYLQCRMDDVNADRDSIKLEYQVGENEWRPMELVETDSPGMFRAPNPGVLEGRVRATGKDKAGNVRQRIIDLGDPTKSFVAEQPQLRPQPTAPAESNHVATAAAVVPEAPPEVEIPLPGGMMPRQTSARVQEIGEVRVPLPQASSSTPASSYNPNRPAILPSGEVPAIPEVVPSTGKPNNLESAPLSRSSEKPASLKTNDPYFPPLETAAPAQNPGVPTATNVMPAAAQQAPAPRKIPEVKVEPPLAKVEPVPSKTEPVSELQRPAAANTRNHDIINTPRCSIEYAVENMLVAGPAKVEFWATRDNGRTWVRVHDESAGRTPAKLVLPGDGFYGIRVKANGNSQSPHTGEAPDCWIEVDTTRPTVRLLPPTIGVGADAGTLTIPYVVNDKNLVVDSINIFYANRPDGPWLPVATALHNEGSYRWLLPSGIGSDIYLRLEASDRAGNTGQGELRDPVTLPQPKVRVLGIGPTR